MLGNLIRRLSMQVLEKMGATAHLGWKSNKNYDVSMPCFLLYRLKYKNHFKDRQSFQSVKNGKQTPEEQLLVDERGKNGEVFEMRSRS